MAKSHPERIKAIIQPEFRVPALELTTLPYPVPKDNEYVLAVRAVAPCKDELGWEAADPHLFTEPRDRVPCIEGSGVVVTPPSVPGDHLPAGTEVFFALDAGVTGALRAFATAPSSGVARRPRALDFPSAAAVPLSALTAWQGIFEHGKLDPAAVTARTQAARAAAREANAKRRVLVAGAAGGVGAWAVRLASAAGATVIGVVRPARADAVRALGATTVLDYEGAAALPERERADIVFDTIGGAGIAQLWGAVKGTGRFLEVGAGHPEESRPQGHTATAQWFLVHTDRAQLEAISALIDADEKPRPQIDEVFPFDKFADAFKKADSGKTSGKVVITVDE
jgi:NADPH:quinone reductase-like Zn-dependent oxidoreductase